ncbi:MAG: FHA domain-containing protein [Bacteroidales bacterium]|nr:FHA domain-containing protein [Bacteroidales bacterium]
MSIKKYILFFVITLNSVLAYSQDFNVYRIDESAFPQITIYIELNTDYDNTSDNIVLEELSKNIDYNIEPTNNLVDHNEGRIYIFLVENSYYIYKKNIFNDIKSTLNQICETLEPEDKINILYFGCNSKNPLKYLSADPSSNTNLIKKMLFDNFAPQTDSTYFDNRLYESIEEATKYSFDCKSSNKPKFLTIISRGLNLSNNLTWSKNFEEQISHSDTYVNVLMYQTESVNAKHELINLANSTNGIFKTIKSEDLEQSLIQLVEKMAKTNTKIPHHCYKITFKTNQNSSYNIVKIKYGNKQQSIDFSNPSKDSILGKHPSTTVAGIIFILIIVIFIIYAIARNKVIEKIDNNTVIKFKEIQTQNKLLKRELEKYRKHPVSLVHSFDNFENEDNLIASGQKAPKIFIDNEGEHISIELTKLVMTIGRSDDNDIVIKNRTVSSHHATLSFEGGFFYINDNESTNGVFVNDIRISKNKVHSNDIIRIGAVFAKLKY